jgi:histidinol-phosphatase
VPAQPPARGEALCRFALELLDETDAIALRHVAAGLRVRSKADATLVTQVDTELEALLRQRIAERHPAHAILGEEMGGQRAGMVGTRWIIDPVDGTHNLVRGIPVWATLLAIEEDGELLAAAVSAPALSRRWWAWRGGGAHVRDPLGERRIGVSEVGRLEEAQVVQSGLRPMDVAGHGDALRTLVRTAWRDRGFGDFWGYLLVAEGAAEVMLEVGPTLWDLAAPALIVAEAGGRLTDFAGVDSYAGPEALATNGRVHAAVLDILRGSAAHGG